MNYPPVILVRRGSSQDIIGTFAPEFSFCKVLFIGNTGLNKTLYCNYEKVSLTLHKSEIKFYTLLLSLSSRRAWIEICNSYLPCRCRTVALLTESVDRNIRRNYHSCRTGVALLTESVDRNGVPVTSAPPIKRRSPHGERG